PELRKRFTGDPEHVINFFRFLAEDLREIMAELGFRTVNEMVGKVELLKVKQKVQHWKYKQLDLRPILYKEPAGEEIGQYKKVEQDHGIDNVLDRKLIAHARLALEEKTPVSSAFHIRNTDRAVGAMLSNEISKRYKGEGLPDGTIRYHFRGSAGQSFGAFSASGLEFTLEGEANDYFGKGLSGARLIVVPDREAKFTPSENIIIGNVAFYGATSGEAYIRGMAGERFAVRNSGVKTVVEGIGDHGCEYMTGGIVVVLGETGKNFAAGMSGGMAYVFNPRGEFERRVNRGMVDLDPMGEEDFRRLHALISNHARHASSQVAHDILQDWDNQKGFFAKVMPRDYKAVLEKRQAQALQAEEAERAAKTA
ncbi:MAG: glutamate synthase subunit alpha, partial [Phaeodactylibacter sp.]|nr:glutamate synthase subunit alpha [Phaeodactylibacter sp.]